MRLFLAVLLLGVPGITPAAQVEDVTIGVSLTALPPWEEMPVEGGKYLIPLPDGDRASKMRKIHLVVPREQAKTLEEALDQEIASIDQRPHQTPYGNGRKNFLGATSFRTESGIEGLCALFGRKGEDGTHYDINKYYFRHKDGSIFKVCAHVYGDQPLAGEYDRIIKQGLRYQKMSADPSRK